MGSSPPTIRSAAWAPVTIAVAATRPTSSDRVRIISFPWEVKDVGPRVRLARPRQQECGRVSHLVRIRMNERRQSLAGHSYQFETNRYERQPIVGRWNAPSKGKFSTR